MYCQTIVAIFACSFALAACTPFKDCGSEGATITAINVPGCDTEPCQLKKGTNVSFEMDFTAKEDISALTTKITAYLGPVPVPFNPPDTDACHFTSCPIKSGANAVYKQNLPVLSSYPSLTVNVQWKLVDATGKAATCFMIAAQVV